MFDFLVFVLLFSVLSQEIGRDECLRNDLFCVRWDVKLKLVLRAVCKQNLFVQC